MTRILIIGLDEGRWGPARLVSALSAAGIEVASLCSEANPLYASSCLAARYRFSHSRSWRTLGSDLCKAISDFRPDMMMPADEQVVVLLQHLAERKAWLHARLDERAISILEAALGDASQRKATVFKYETRLLAEKLGVRTPQTRRVQTATEAVQAADEIGYPVYVKASFAWAGLGNYRCKTPEEVRNAFLSLYRESSAANRFLRHLMGRDWYPTEYPIEVQASAPGVSAMYNVLAWRGQVLGGFFATRSRMVADGGPSTIVQISANPVCAAIAERMVQSMGISGFLAFDFMWNDDQQEAYLLECNPRPNQIFHLGEGAGVDLSRSLALALQGSIIPIGSASRSVTHALFPQHWIADEDGALSNIRMLDIPLHDKGLLARALLEGERTGCNVDRLHAAIRAEGCSEDLYFRIDQYASEKRPMTCARGAFSVITG